MIDIESLKPIARISKNKSNLLLKTFRTNTKKIHIFDEKACESCPYKEYIDLNYSTNNYCDYDDSNSKFNNPICFTCKKRNDSIELSYYDTKKTSFSIFEIVKNKFSVKALSKSAIIQFLCYHFIPGNQNKVRKAVSFAEIASLCDISIPTARANHQKLVELGLVYSTKNSVYGKIDIIIDDEYKNHNTKEEDGEGYLTLSLDILKHLMSFDNVNNMKVELKKILLADVIKSPLKEYIQYSRDSISSVLPEYIRKSHKKVNEILNNKDTLFELEGNKLNTNNYKEKNILVYDFKRIYRDKVQNFFYDTGLSFSKNYTYLIKELEQRNSIKTNNSINTYNNLINLEVNKIERDLETQKSFIIEDIVNLAIQYGINKVLDVLKHMFINHSYVDEEGINENEIRNPGGFIRSYINFNINKLGSLNI
jgi:hypothetical protein